MSSKLEKLHKESKAKNSEHKIIEFCLQNWITCIKLDEELGSVKSEYLKRKQWKCPDFYCEINWNSLFIEVKTITNTTNDAREKKIKEWIIEVFEPQIELIWPMTSLLKDASEKFKNIKSEYKHIPKILFITGIFWEQEHFINSIFWGIYEAYKFTSSKEGDWWWIKNTRWLFDSTGSNVSAIVYWNDSTEQLNCLANHNAVTSFDEESFYNFSWRFWKRELSALRN